MPLGKLELLKKKEMPLLSRVRYTFSCGVSDSTPSRLEFKEAVAKELKVGPELVIIKHIYTKYGKRMVKIIAHAYDNKEDLAKFEHAKLVEKHKGPEAPAEEAAEAPAEDEAEDKPAEAVADEKPAEEAKAE